MTDPRSCAQCGQVFTPRAARAAQRFCSRVCLHAGHGTGPKRRLADRACAQCGKPFRPHDAGKRFCSRNCGNRGRSKMQPRGIDGPPYSLTQAARLLGCDPGGLVRRRRKLGVGTFVPGRGPGHWEFSAADLVALGDGLRVRRPKPHVNDAI